VATSVFLGDFAVHKGERLLDCRGGVCGVANDLPASRGEGDPWGPWRGRVFPNGKKTATCSSRVSGGLRKGGVAPPRTDKGFRGLPKRQLVAEGAVPSSYDRLAAKKGGLGLLEGFQDDETLTFCTARRGEKTARAFDHDRVEDGLRCPVTRNGAFVI